LPEATVNVRTAKRILLCTGKIFYELEKFREQNQRDDVAIIRAEQLYPLRAEHLEPALADYRDGIPAFWVQEEPENMGAWRHMLVTFGNTLLDRFPFRGISRPPSATPATVPTRAMNASRQRSLTAAFNRK
jgi:2-oxoglutarate dehydrogenase E1 component